MKWFGESTKNIKKEDKLKENENDGKGEKTCKNSSSKEN